MFNSPSQNNNNSQNINIVTAAFKDQYPCIKVTVNSISSSKITPSIFQLNINDNEFTPTINSNYHKLIKPNKTYLFWYKETPTTPSNIKILCFEELTTGNDK